MSKKKLRLRGVDLSGEIRSGILRRLVLISRKMVGWQPIWCKFCVAWGPLGFRARLAHPWALGSRWPLGPAGDGRRAGGRASSNSTGSPTPKIAIPRCGGKHGQIGHREEWKSGGGAKGPQWTPKRLPGPLGYGSCPGNHSLSPGGYREAAHFWGQTSMFYARAL